MEALRVNVWEEQVVIPTYGIGKPNKNPMFFEKRIYQGSSGVVYPNPIIEKILDEKTDKEYRGLFLENKYLKVMILPELGGRIQMAYDKIKDRHFIYYNQVIKPALVGLTGPWISGGIEFNWPQHHRPSTFSPVDYKIEENIDGSKTVWVNEIEQMFHTKGMAGFTLHPDKAYIEIKAKLLNRSELPQTFLWWANPAVKVNDDYQSVFPPDVNAVFDHGKRDVSTFPIATGTYYKVDYSPGTDISMYKNIPVPTSYMAINSNYDFVGGYEHDSKGGLLHVADHHVSPGKKQWTWGHGDFGQAWDRNLTDEDGPYIELMTGMFTDNQPDFTWLMPNEEKSFTQYFMPYRELGMIKNASKDILMAFNKFDKKFEVKIYTTSSHGQLSLDIKIADQQFKEDGIEVSPEKLYQKEFLSTSPFSEEQVVLVISDRFGKELLRYEPKQDQKNEIPSPAIAALEPEEINSTEQLFLTGQHLEQYRHATYSPVPYYQRALELEPTDIRNNNALGLWYLRRGQFALSETYFRTAIKTATLRNPNPYDGEPYYNLGLCLRFLGRNTEAYGAFFKATWSNAWKATGYFAVAQLDVANGDYSKALQHIDLAIDGNANNSKAYVVKAAVLRRLGIEEKVSTVLNTALERDMFNLGALFEQKTLLEKKGLLKEAETVQQQILALSRGEIQNFIAYALDYATAGLYEEAISLLTLATESLEGAAIAKYYIAYFHHKMGSQNLALAIFKRAAQVETGLYFHNRLEEIEIFRTAISYNPMDAKAPYYLGNLFYDKRQYREAISLWEASANIDDSFPTVWRNLGIAYFNKQSNSGKALACFEKAFALDTTDDRLLMELHQLYKRLNRSPKERLLFLEQHIDVAMERDDVYLELVTLYNFMGSYQKAYQLLMNKTFHPWEGGEGKASGQYVFSLTQMARVYISKGEFEKAIDLLEQAQTYPHNLGEGKLAGAQENDIFYLMGCAHEGLGSEHRAADYFRKATYGSTEPSAAIFYNDQQPDQIFYQGLAWKKLGEEEKANGIFERLVAYGLQHLDDKIKIDYFAVSLPNLLIFDDDLDLRNKIHCYFISGLGHLGMVQSDEANQAFAQVLRLDAEHLGAKRHLEMVKPTGGVFQNLT